jgi:hypothetical protein
MGCGFEILMEPSKPDYRRIQAECRKKAGRVLRVPTKMLVPRSTVRMMDGTLYEIKKDGS